jgi:hypothetical protein
MPDDQLDNRGEQMHQALTHGYGPKVARAVLALLGAVPFRRWRVRWGRWGVVRGRARSFQQSRCELVEAAGVTFPDPAKPVIVMGL